MSDTVAAGQLRAFVERIIRLKEEQDTLAADIRDIYAEAKGSGFDKTAMGQVVAHVRKIGKIGVSAVEEKQTVFDLYLNAYERGNGGALSHTHTREAAAEFQPARVASMAEQRSAFREGAPISQDFTYENATVYFIAFHGINRVKIGLSNEVDRRIADLEKACGDVAEIIAVIPGNRKAEMAALRHHAEWCISGEWFDLCDELIASIKAYADEPAATHTHEKPKSPSHAAVVTDDHLREPVAAASGQIIREDGDAPQEASDGGKLSDTEFEPPAFLVKAAKPLRPLCLNPSECAGYGTHTCHQCLKAAGQSEAA